MPMPTDRKIGVILLSLGAVATALSIFYELTVLAFTGLTLAFWGCLFLLVLTGRYIKVEVMDQLVISSLTDIDQMIAESGVQGTPMYIPVPKEMYLPYSIGIKNEFVYIPRRKAKVETVLEQSLMRKPDGIRLSPPGLGLANFIEKKAGVSFHNLSLDSAFEVFPSTMTSDFELAHDFKISLEGNRVRTEVKGSSWDGLCKEARGLEHLCLHVGCPFCSSVACVLTRVTNRPVIMESCVQRGGNIETSFLIVKEESIEEPTQATTEANVQVPE